ncbi:MAG TPA: pitrilysin family protein [Blastocatellia bacterium]|nr:pitrilysin family protein [Blastocatellia bacterium]
MRRLLALSLVVLLAASQVQPANAENGDLKLPPYKKVKLKNGMTLLLMQQHEVPIISFNFLLRAGSIADPAGKEGLASLVAGLLRKGTKTRSADQLSTELDFIGGLLGASATYDYTGGFAEFVKKDIGKGLELMSDVLLNPTFPEDEVTKLVKQRIDGIKSAKDQAQAVIGTYFSSYLYGSHPYARPTGGDERSLAAITRDDVVKFYQAHYTPSSMILAVAGDFSAADMERQLTTVFDGWAAKPAPEIKLPEVEAFKGKKLLLIDKPDSTQTFFNIGNVGITRTNPDRVYIDVVNTLFGGRFTSMLNSALRINSGLTYGARSSFVERKVRGPFLISTYTSNKTTEQAIDMALDILKQLHEKGITEEDLKSAKTYIKGVFPTSIETSDQLASIIAQLEFYGLDEKEINGYYARIDSMTMADTQRVIKQYFPLENLVFVLIGKSSEIEPIAKKYAPKLDTKNISQPGF